MKGIILAGGSGTRLYPITMAISKQLMPIYDKPMIYYPIATLIDAGISEILIITTPQDQAQFQRLLGDGNQIECKFEYAVQPKPEGLAQAFIIAEDFIGSSSTCLILGDNLFYGAGLKEKLQQTKKEIEKNGGGEVFAYQVGDPQKYGVVEFDNDFKVVSIEEKPEKPKSNYAIPGIYFFDNNVVEIAKKVKPSQRGELEITEIHNAYLAKNQLKVTVMTEGTTWLDTGTFDSMNQASQFVKLMEDRQNIKVGCIEESAWKAGLINSDQLSEIAKPLIKSGYGEYLNKILSKKEHKNKPKFQFSFSSVKIILLTGCAGFIGSNFVNKYVPQNPQISFVNLDKLTYAANLNNVQFLPANLDELNSLVEEKKWQINQKSIQPNYEFVQGDITNKSFLANLFEKYQFDAIIHFAAESHVDFSITNPELFVEVNVLGTQNLLDLARKFELKRFHHVSTDEVYGELPLNNPEIKFTEKTHIAPNSPYSASKAGSDLLVRASHETFKMNTVTTRCSNNYGPYQDLSKLIPKFVTNLLKGQKVPVYGGGQNIRDWLFVEDHCDAIWEVFKNGKAGEVYNIGGNNEKTNMQITKKLLEITGRDESFIEYVADRPGHDLRYAIDASKMKNELGWEPKYTFETGIEKTIEFYKNQI